MKPAILLSYDVEEFDLPFEYGGHLNFEKQLELSTEGMTRLIKLLNVYGIKCTFYCTATYALNRMSLIQALHQQGYEIASHGFYHSRFREEDLLTSRESLEDIIKAPVYGYRMARMMPLDSKVIAAAGYAYNSSINPTWIPGRYNNLHMPRTLFREAGIWQLPASVTPMFRLPLFWLGFHNYPFDLYLRFCRSVIQKDGYANIYFHPWEFIDYKGVGGAKFPGYVTKNAGNAMLDRTEKLIQWALQQGYVFETTWNWLRNKNEVG